MQNSLLNLSIQNFLPLLDTHLYKNWIFIDLESTGLLGHSVEQITQIAALETVYSKETNTFNELDNFNKKIKLLYGIQERMGYPDSKIADILKMNHYYEGEYWENRPSESESLSYFKKWIDSKRKDTVLVMQNAPFDMDLLNGRSTEIKFTNDIFDTKLLIQYYYIPLIEKLAENDNFYKRLLSTIGKSERDNGLISSSFSKIGPALNVNMNKYHDAEADCRITIDIVTAIYRLLSDNIYVDIEKYQKIRQDTKMSK